MATRLYFHDAAHSGTGTFPTGEQGAAVPDVSLTGATTLKTMNTTIGVGATHVVATSSLTIATDGHIFNRFWASPTLDVDQTVGGGLMWLNGASSQSNLAANYWWNGINIYVWRPSTGAIVGTILDNSAGAPLGGTESSVTNSVRVDNITSIATSAVNALAGDVIVAESWSHIVNSGGKTYTLGIYYDGQTVTTVENTVVTSQASFVELSENITFGTPVTARPRSFAVVI